MQTKLLTYTGTGVDNLAVTGTSFTPDFILIHGGGNITVSSTRTMAADNSKRLAGSSALEGGSIKTVTSTGFTLGTNGKVNTLGTVYYALCVLTEVADSKILTYTGTGSGFGVTGVGFQPNAIIVLPADTGSPFYVTSDMAAGNAMRFQTGPAATGRITSLDADGFTVGTDAGSNTSTVVYHVLALKSVSSVFTTFTYTGNGSDNRNIATFGFQPDYLLISQNATAQSVQRFKGEVGDASFAIDSAGEFPNFIQSFIAGGFQVGSDTIVNQNANTYYSFGFKETAVVTPSSQADALFFGAAF